MDLGQLVIILICLGLAAVPLMMGVGATYILTCRELRRKPTRKEFKEFAIAFPSLCWWAFTAQ